jgi:tetratricopeptide (TPR) repeat protein
LSDPSLPPLPPADEQPHQDLDRSRFGWPGGLLPLPLPLEAPGPDPLPIDLQKPVTPSVGQVNFPFVDQQAVEQLEYLDKISVRWNRKLLAGICLLTLLLATGGYLLRNRFLENWATTWKREAEELAAQGDLAAAVAKAKLALRLDPDDRLTRLLAGRALVRPAATRQEYEEGRDLLEEHLAEDPLDRENRLLLIRSAMQRGDHRWVLTEGLVPVRTVIPTDPEFRALALECHRVGGESVEAARLLVRAIDKSPQDPQLFRQLLELIDLCEEPAAQLRGFVEDLNAWRQTLDDNLEELPVIHVKEAETGDGRIRQRILSEQAMTVLRRMRARVQPGWWFLLALSEHALRQGDDVVAEFYWRQAREASPDHPEVATLGVEVLETRWQKHAAAGNDQQVVAVESEARELLQQAVQGRDAALGLFEVLGRLQVVGRQFPAARLTYRAGLEEVAKRSESLSDQERKVWSVVFHLGLAESLTGEEEDASERELEVLEQEWQRLLRELADQPPRPEVTEFVNSLREFAQGRLDGAVRRLETLRDQLQSLADRPTHDLIERIDTWLCECHRRLSREEQLRNALWRALADRPDWHQGRKELGRLLVRQGLPWQSLRQAGAETEAEKSVDELEWKIAEQLRRPPSQRDWDEVDEQLESLAEQLPGNSRIGLLRAERLVESEKVVDAVDLLSKQLKDKPANPELATGLVRLLRWHADHSRTDNAAWMAQVADAFRRAQGEVLVSRLLQAEGRGLGSARENLDPQEISQFWEGAASWPVRQKRGLARGLLRLAQQSGRDSSLLEVGRYAVRVGLRDLDLLAQVAAAADRADDSDLAEQARGAMARWEGEAGPWGLLLSAYRTLLKLRPLDGTPPGVTASEARTELSAVLRDLEQASAQRPDWGIAHRLRGIAWDLWGNPGEAGKAFQLAVRHGDRSPEALSWLSDHLFRLRRDRELVDLHEGWSSESRPTVLAAELSSTGAIDLRLGGKPARDQAEQLALVQLAVAQETPVEETLPQLVELTRKAPHLAGAWHLRASLAAEQGGAAAGRDVVSELARAVPPLPPDRRSLIEALCYDALGEEGLVEERFRAAIDVESDGWECTREWVAWLVRRGELDRAVASLDEPPPRLATELTAAFADWSRAYRHIVGAAGATTVPEFRRHLAEIKPEGTGARNSFWQDRWYACLARGRSASENQQLLQWLDQRRQSVGLTPDQHVARLRAGLRRGELQFWNDWQAESSGRPLDLATALLILEPVVRNPLRMVDEKLEPLIEEAFDVLRKREPKSLRTRAVDAARFLQQGFPQDGTGAYQIYRQRIPGKSPAELLLDLAGAGRLTRLRARLASVAPNPWPADSPWSVLDRFPTHRELFLNEGELPELEPLWQIPEAQECLRDEALLLVGLGLESIADAESARPVFEAYSERGRLPADRFELALYLARQGELTEAQQLINLMAVDEHRTEVDLALGIAWVFDSAPFAHDSWSIPLRRLEAVRKDSLNPAQQRRLRHQLARLQALTGHEERGLAGYLELLQDQPDDLIARNNLAWLRGITGRNLDEAREESDRLISRLGELPELLDTRAVICLTLGDLPQAQADWELAISQAPLGRYLAQLSVCQSRLGDRVAARRTARQALLLGFQSNAWLPPERELWGGEFNTLLRESAEVPGFSAGPQGTAAQNPPLEAETKP